MANPIRSGEVLPTRRQVLVGGGLATLGLALPRSAARRPRQTVAVFGGGVAGLTAAHELVQRGFAVTVYERRAWGGKARSTTVPGSGRGGRMDLPGEHGFRVEFGFYQNLPDTMSRIPFGSNPRGVFDNMVALPQVEFARRDKPDLVLPLGQLDPRPYRPEQVVQLLEGLALSHEIPPAAAAYFANRMGVFFSSCHARRIGEWENVSWTDFIGTARFDPDYGQLLGRVPEFVQASKAENTSATFVATVLELLVYSLMGFGATGPAIRTLDGPTDETWITPWTRELRRLGVRLQLGSEVEALDVQNGHIAGAQLRGSRGLERVQADWYVCALPVERARHLSEGHIAAVDPRLQSLEHLPTAWMNGISYYLTQRPALVRGVIDCVDSPWALTVVPQAGLWRNDFSERYGDGRVKEKLSLIIANWGQPGVLYGKPAGECSPQQVAREAWVQLKQHLNSPGSAPVITDAMLHSWQIDPGMIERHGRLVSTDPLVLPTTGSYQHRPEVTTRVPNLVLAGDYLKSEWLVANMEAANYNGRRAANAVLEASGSRQPPATVTGPYQPPEWQAAKEVDRRLYARGQPNALDVPVS